MQSEYYIKTGNFRITSSSILTSLKYLSKKYKIDYKSLVFDIDKNFDKPITFKNCLGPNNEIYLNLPNKHYKLAFNKNTVQGKTIDSVVNNACILARINSEDIYDIERMRYYILEFAGSHLNNKTLSTITVNELLFLCCCNLKGKIENDTIVDEILEQCRKNCRHKVVTKGQISSSEKKSLSHMKFGDEERDYVKFLFSEGYSYRAIIPEFEDRYNKKISLYGVQTIIKSA